MLKFLLARLREPSTLAGLGVLAAFAGVDPAKADAVIQATGCVLGAAAMLIPEGRSNAR